MHPVTYDTYIFKVSDAESTTKLEIMQPKVSFEIIEPNRHSVWRINDFVNIRYSFIGKVDRVKITLVRDDTARTIRDNAIANGEYGFNVPEDAIPGKDAEYRVRIEKISFQGELSYGYSDYFRIKGIDVKVDLRSAPGSNKPFCFYKSICQTKYTINPSIWSKDINSMALNLYVKIKMV